MVLMKSEGGTRSGVLATRVVRTRARSAARYRMSLIACGHASASTQIFNYAFRIESSPCSSLVAIQSPHALFPPGHFRLPLPREHGHPHAHAAQPSRELTRRVHPRVFSHRPPLVDLNLRLEGVVEGKQETKLLTESRLGERVGAIPVGHMAKQPRLVHGLQPPRSVRQLPLELADDAGRGRGPRQSLSLP